MPPVKHYAMSACKGFYTACGKKAWYTRTRWTHNIYGVTCSKCKRQLALARPLATAEELASDAD